MYVHIYIYIYAQCVSIGEAICRRLRDVLALQARGGSVQGTGKQIAHSLISTWSMRRFAHVIVRVCVCMYVCMYVKHAAMCI